MNTFFKTFKLIKFKEKISLFVIFILSLVGVIIDVLTTILIYPLINVFYDNNFEFNFKNYDLFGILDSLTLKSSPFLVIILLITIFYFLKAIILTFKVFYNEKILANLQKRLSYDFYHYYLFKDLNFIKIENNAILVRNIKNEVDNFCHKNIPILINLATDLILFIGISSVLFYLNPYFSLIIIIFFSFLALFFITFTKKLNLKYGKIRAEFSKKLMKHIIETFNSFNILKVSNKEPFFLSLFKGFNSKEIDSRKKQNIIVNLPSLWLEFIGIFLILLLVTYSLKLNMSQIELFSYLGVFFVSMYRILPSINRMIKHMQALRYGEVSLNILSEKLGSQNILEQKDSSQLNNKYLLKKEIKFKNVSFGYENKQILDNLNFVIKKNTITGIMGPSGSGKSTLLNLILGFLSPDKGQITIDNLDLKEIRNNWQKSIGYVPQDVYMLDESIANNIAFGENEKKISIEKIKNSLIFSEMEDFVNNLKNKENTVIGDTGSLISGGQKQRLGLARALYNNPSILILDETTSSLDEENELKIFETINKIKENCTIIIVSHRKNVYKICDEIIHL
jgi:ABC-type multidrug transport system fused ATPase/permease subunit